MNYSKSLIIEMTRSRKVPSNQKKNRSPWLSGSWYCEEILVKNPGNQGTCNFFYQTRYCKDHGNQGTNNQGPAVGGYYLLTPIITNSIWEQMRECCLRIQCTAFKDLTSWCICTLSSIYRILLSCCYTR